MHHFLLFSMDAETVLIVTSLLTASTTIVLNTYFILRFTKLRYFNYNNILGGKVKKTEKLGFEKQCSELDGFSYDE